MSWGAVAKSATSAFKQGYDQRKQTRDQADPSGGGYASSMTPGPAPMPTPQQVMPAADPMTVGAQPTPVAAAPAQDPLMALLHAIWQRPSAPMR